jgi:Transmembrane domain of unknown function (DUF3566)
MTERSAEQAPVQTRPDHQDTARIPLAERLQRRISAANGERRAATTAPHESSSRETGRVLPPMPPDLAQQRTDPRTEQRASAPEPAPQQRSVQAVPPQSAPEQTAQVPVVPVREATAPRRTPTSPTRSPRRARLRLSRIDPWSVMKVSFLLSIAFGIVTVVSVFMVWSVLGAAGVWSSINNTVSDTVSSGNNVSTFNIEDYLGMSRVLGFTMLVSVIDVILITAIATLGAFLYNMSASLLGGVEVTLSEDS